jgi:type I restriction enzyme, S subunit
MKWEKATLGRLAKMVGGGTPSKKREDFWNGNIPWVSPKDMSFREIFDAEDHITKAAVRGSATQVVPIGSILIVVRSGILVRRFPIAIARVPLTLNQDMKAILPGGLLEPEFLAYALAASEQTVLGQCVKRGATVHSIDISKLQKLEFPIPAKSEQLRIVEILNQANVLLKKRADSEAKADRILPALFYKMFGDPTTNQKGWNVKPLSDFEAEIRYGLGQPPNISVSGVALIRATNISRGTISLVNMIYVDPQDVPPERNAFLKEGEVLVVRSGAYTGDVAQVTKEWDGCVAGYDLVITPGKNLLGEFVEAYLLTPFIQKGYFYNLKARAGQPHLNAAQVAATPFLEVPRYLQVKFSDAVQSMRILRKKQEAASENLERAFAAILHRAFAGDLTAQWRETHMKELLAEMEMQSKQLNLKRSEP